MTTDRPLHFVTLVGSLRQGSYNAAIARTLIHLAPVGVIISELGSVGDFPHYNEDVEKGDGFPSAVTDMADAIRRADGVIIVTPEYNYSVPGALKNALDWLSRLPTPPFVGKRVLIQTASPGPLGGVRAQYHLRQIMVFLDAHVFNKPEVMVMSAARKINPETHELSDPDTRDFIISQLTAFAAFVQTKRVAAEAV